MKKFWTFTSYLVVALTIPIESRADDRQPENAPVGWTAEAPRDEIRPHFSWEADGGPSGTGCFVMTATGKSENTGQWTGTVPVTGGRHFSFRTVRKVTSLESPRRNTMANYLAG